MVWTLIRKTLTVGQHLTKKTRRREHIASVFIVITERKGEVIVRKGKHNRYREVPYK